MEKNNKKYEDEINFKALLKEPKRLFGWVFPYFLFIVLIIGVFYVHNLNTVSTNSVPVNPPLQNNVIPTIEMKKGTVTEPIDTKMITDPSREIINTGKELFQNNCASCHGDNGQGDGPAGQSLDPSPRNFTSTDGWVNGRNFSNMYKTLEEGIPGSGMTAYEFMPPKDRISIIHYVRTFADFPEVTEDEVRQLEQTYQLSKGRRTANRIPVDLAIDKLIRENNNGTEVSLMNDFIYNHPNEEGKVLFDKYVKDEYRVLSSFYSNDIGNMSFDKFIKVLEDNTVELGFIAEVNNLDRNDLRKIYDFMQRVVSIAKG